MFKKFFILSFLVLCLTLSLTNYAYTATEPPTTTPTVTPTATPTPTPQPTATPTPQPTEPPTTTTSKKDEITKGMELYYRRQYKEAIPYFERAIEIAPNDTLALSYFIMSHIRVDPNLAKLTAEYEELVTKNPNSPTARLKLGFLYYGRSMFDKTLVNEATTEFNRVLQLDPRNSAAHTALGLIYHDKRLISRAKTHFKEALSINSFDVLANETLGVIFQVDEKSPDIAATYFRIVASLYPEYPAGRFHLGSALYDMKKYQEATTHLEEAVKNDPLGLGDGFFAAMLLGDTYMHLKIYKEAVEAYKKASKMDPTVKIPLIKLEKAEKLLKKEENK